MDLVDEMHAYQESFTKCLESILKEQFEKQATSRRQISKLKIIVELEGL